MTDWTEIDNKLLDPQWYTTTEYHEVFKKLRDEDPVHWTQDDKYGKHYWTITRYDDVKSYLQNHDQLSSRWDTRVPRSPQRRTPEQRFEQGRDISFASNDNPIHDLYRRPLNKHFSVPAVARLSGHVEDIVDDVVRKVADLGSCNAAEAITDEVPLKVVLSFMGVPEEDWGLMQKITGQWLSSADPRFMIDNDPVATSWQGQKVLLDYCEEMTLERRKNPRDDFATLIAQMKIDDDLLSPHEMRSYMSQIIGGGLETSSNALSTGLYLFLTNPDQRELLLENPDLTNNAVEEIIRWTNPAKSRLRVAVEDFEFGGKLIRRGQWVVGFLASANKDERHFENPDRFDIQRRPDHLGFGEGIHMCLGRALARLEIGTLLPRVLSAFPDMEVTGEPTWLADHIGTGITNLPVRYTPGISKNQKLVSTSSSKN